MVVPSLYLPAEGEAVAEGALTPGVDVRAGLTVAVACGEAVPLATVPVAAGVPVTITVPVALTTVPVATGVPAVGAGAGGVGVVTGWPGQ